MSRFGGVFGGGVVWSGEFVEECGCCLTDGVRSIFQRTLISPLLLHSLSNQQTNDEIEAQKCHRNFKQNKPKSESNELPKQQPINFILNEILKNYSRNKVIINF